MSKVVQYRVLRCFSYGATFNPGDIVRVGQIPQSAIDELLKEKDPVIELLPAEKH